MRLIVDSNILFTFFWGNSVFRGFQVREDLELFSPENSLSEINKYSKEIQNRAKISEPEFKELRNRLRNFVTFVHIDEYLIFIDKAKLLAEELPQHYHTEFLDDIDFFALALKLNCPIWSNDKLFKKQSRIEVFTTEDIINLLP